MYRRFFFKCNNEVNFLKDNKINVLICEWGNPFGRGTKFEKIFPEYKIVENKLTEFLIFLNSGGVNSNFFHLKLNSFFLKFINIIDNILIFFLPKIFALNRTVVLKKNK